MTDPGGPLEPAGPLSPIRPNMPGLPGGPLRACAPNQAAATVTVAAAEPPPPPSRRSRSFCSSISRGRALLQHQAPQRLSEIAATHALTAVPAGPAVRQRPCRPHAAARQPSASPAERGVKSMRRRAVVLTCLHEDHPARRSRAGRQCQGNPVGLWARCPLRSPTSGYTAPQKKRKSAKGRKLTSGCEFV